MLSSINKECLFQLQGKSFCFFLVYGYRLTKHCRQCTYNVILRCFRVPIVAVGKQEVLRILSLFVALVIRHAKRMLRIILSSVLYRVLPYFSILSHKRHDFWGGKMFNVKCVFWLSIQLSSETYFILRISQRSTIISLHSSSCRGPVMFVIF